MSNRPDASGAGRAAVRPDAAAGDARSIRDRGNAYYLQGRFTEAEACYREALRLRPDEAETHNNLGAALADQGLLEAAIMSYREALRLLPEYADAFYNLGNALRLSGRYAEAVACYGQALRLRPGSAEAHNNLGTALLRLGRLSESITSLREALRLRPGYTLALINLGLALAESGRLAEAIACDDEALRVEPENADAHRNRALALLLVGDLTRGWADYQWRWRCADFIPPRFSRPLWDGSPLEGRTILLYTEQGLGDTLQFVRYARLVKRRGGVVILAAQAPLLPLLTGGAGIDRFVARDASLPDFDVHYPLMSLPGLFGTTLVTIPAEVPYLRAEPARVERWRRALGPIRGFRVGIAWQGSPTNPDDRRRSIPLVQFAPLARVEGVRLISLQRGTGLEQLRALDGRFPVIDLAGRSDDPGASFLDTAAIMANLDLVVTCDTSVAHLAGALGFPTWVALAAVPDWRWLLDREDSPWYPTLRLFRQVHQGIWVEPFERMARMLGDRVAARPGPGSIAVAITPGELLG
ncbi:MAG: glycosyltransferase family protein [Planctomycetaceae bacterium]|nr:glycosyltransferase family protein [Planctomycetaceae bacterium]